MKHVTEDDLLDLVRGELPPAAAREAEEHAEICLACRRELAWLRTEQGLFRAQPAPLPAHTWQGIERRVIIADEGRTERRRRVVAGGGAVAVFAAAAGLLIYVWGHGLPVAQRAGSVAVPTKPDPTNDELSPDHVAPSKVLDDAEREYKRAIVSLEAAYEGERDRIDPDVALRYDGQLRHLRDVVVEARATAGEDPWARRRVLRAYSMYMHSMQAVVMEVQK